MTTDIERVHAEIGILIYPDAQLAAVHGLTDLFTVANRMAATRPARGTTPLRVSHWQRDKKGKSPVRVFDTHPDLKSKPQIVISPPSLGTLASPQDLAPYASWLRERHADGAALASVCAGAFLVAETGLLAGRSATTHWVYAETLKERYPDIDVAADKLIVDDGDIITAGGLMAWTDLGLKLVDRLLGPTIMADTARFLLVDPPGREQRYYSNFAPKLHHGDEAILKVQHWLQSKGARDVTQQEMATRAGMEPRTFLRRFHKATGLKPTEYCQNVRVGKARELLEFTTKSIDQIAWSVGYEDTGAFRKVFQKVLGLSPGEYRNRFAVKRAPAS